MNTTSHAQFRRLVEQDVSRGLSRGRRERLHDHLRACDACRAHHDRLHEGLRVLEGDAFVTRAELEQLERWVVQGLPPTRSPRLRLFAWLTPALLAAVATVVLLRRGSPVDTPDLSPGLAPSHVMALVAKGGDARAALAVDVLCGPRPDALHAASPGGCTLDETLAFAYRAVAPDQSPPAGTLTLFGVDARGRARYYAPTPAEPAGVDVAAGAWRAAPLSVRLNVNHAAGPLRLYALLSPAAPRVEDIDAWSGALADAPPDDPTPWHRRLDPAAARALCGPELAACRSARLELTLYETPHEEDR